MNKTLESLPGVSSAVERAQEWKHDLRENAQKATRVATEYIEENPWKAILIVAVCALALGFLLKPRTD